MKSPDEVRVTTVVEVEPSEAFEVFTGEIDRWWRKGPHFRGGGTLSFVSRSERVAQRGLIEQHNGEVFEVGRVLEWEPGARLVFEWRGRSFQPGETTEVDVSFEPHPDGTRVTVLHRGWSKLPADHPARRGLMDESFDAMIGMWWGDLLTGLRAHVRRV